MKENAVTLGATFAGGGVHFAVWAPNARLLEVVVETQGRSSIYPLERGADSIHTGFVRGLDAGARYRYRLDEGQMYPDPYSRFQPEGPHGPSEVVDPSRYFWTDHDWPGITMDGLVIYECHVGTYTEAGTFEALRRELPELRRLGVHAIELMPVAEFPGCRNWGYDGVDLFTPTCNYGSPGDLRDLVNAAHREGLGVILDVVYNHLGPDGNYLRAFSDDYFTDRHQTPWGDAINFDGQHNEWVRRFVIDNARRWIEEYHVDGLRLDAPDTIVDESPTHILAELADTVRAATTRNVVLIAENDTRSIQSRATGGFGLDAIWADDFHHELRVLLTNAHEMHYADYAGSMEQIALAIEHGFPDRRPSAPASNFVLCLQNHDQVGNRPFGERIHHEINLEQYAVVSTLLLFVPETVLLFMGQEFAASTPFLFFSDHDAALGPLITEGRRQEFAGYRAFADEAWRNAIPDPQSASTFLDSKLELRERRRNRGVYDLYRTLLALRRDDPVLAVNDRHTTRASALGARAIAVHRWWGDEHRLLIANVGSAFTRSMTGIAQLTGAPSAGWRIRFSTSQRRYGGSGARPRLHGRGGDRTIEVPARSAVILSARH
ncbi:MAG: malto-oligosyltrehalose trehalohydrolase [Thermomicrobiales bacterium]